MAEGSSRSELDLLSARPVLPMAALGVSKCDRRCQRVAFRRECERRLRGIPHFSRPCDRTEGDKGIVSRVIHHASVLSPARHPLDAPKRGPSSGGAVPV